MASLEGVPVMQYGGGQFRRCKTVIVQHWQCVGCSAFLVIEESGGTSSVTETPQHGSTCDQRPETSVLLSTADGTMLDIKVALDTPHSQVVYTVKQEGVEADGGSEEEAGISVEPHHSNFEVEEDTEFDAGSSLQVVSKPGRRRGRKPKQDKVKYECQICDKVFIRPCRLEEHMTSHEASAGSVTARHGCGECGKAFLTPLRLRTHLKLHANKDKYECSECSRSFALEYRLKMHMNLHTKQKTFLCNHCGVSFAQRDYLTRHERRMHLKQRRLECGICQRRFFEKKDLDGHVRTHTQERPYVCQYCGKAIRSQSQYVVHLRTHTGERPYPCHTCGKGFLTSGNLQKHVRIHTGERPYTCDVCSHAFAEPHQHRRHEAIHQGARDHLCDGCESAFTKAEVYQGFLKRHKEQQCTPLSETVGIHESMPLM